VPAKTDINTQFGRVSNPDGTSPLGATAINFGLAPLVDSHGRLIVSNAAAANFALDRTANADGSSPSGPQAPGVLQPSLCDSHGRLLSVPYLNGQQLSDLLIRVDSGAIVLWQLISAVPCKLYQAFGAQASGSQLWIHLFDLAAGPPGGAVPYMSALPVPNNGMWSHAFGEGLAFTAGCVIAYSTVITGYTAPVTGGWISALIR
jgi:hypothetical protein